MRRTKSEKWVRPHPATIVLYSLRQILLLLIPIVRALFSSQNDFTNWNRYVWVDLLAIFGMFGFGYMRYLATGFRIEGQGIICQNGLILHRRGYIPFSEISVLVCEKSFFWFPLRYCLVYLDTDAGGKHEADFKIALSYRQYDTIRHELSKVCIDHQAARRISRGKWWEILFLSFLSSDSLSGILFISATISGFGDLFSIDIRQLITDNFEYLYQFANKLVIKIPPVAAWIAYILIITWSISFLMHTVKNMRFTVMRQGNAMAIICGMLSRYDHWIQVKRINRLDIRQTFVTRLLGVQSVFVRSCGYGKQSQNLAVLLPAGTNTRVKAQLSLLLPEYPITSNQIRSKKKYLLRFAALPFWMSIGEILLFWKLSLLLPNLKDTVLFVGAAMLIPTLWLFVVRITAYFHNGAGKTQDVYTFRYTYGYRFMTTVVQKEKITSFTIRQTVFQRMNGGCDLLIYVRDEKKAHFTVCNLNRKEVEQIMGI